MSRKCCFQPQRWRCPALLCFKHIKVNIYGFWIEYTRHSKTSSWTLRNWDGQFSQFPDVLESKRSI